ncbi:MAG: hypothetical protein IKS42_00965 [Oscillospiraceae bacterium]|nr:hypothetical protein [Oscillospiraceae bacterium]
MKYKRIGAMIAAAMLLTACQQNPDSGIVVHKDMERVISEAENSDDSKADLAEIRETASEHYETKIENPALHIEVTVNADAELPETDKLSVFRVQQHTFTDADIAKYREVLLGDTELYDYAAAFQKTKRDLEHEIAVVRENYEARLAERTNPDNDTVMQEEHESLMKLLEEQYNAAPDEAPMMRSEGRLKQNAEAFRNDPGNSILKHWNEMSPKGSTLHEISADKKTVFSVINDPAKGNMLTFFVSPTEEGTVYQSTYPIPDRLIVCSGKNVPENFIDHFQYDGSKTYVPVENDSCELSQEEAEQQAEDFMKKLGLPDFVLKEGGRYAELVMDANKTNTLYRTNYILRYVRDLGGVPLRQDSGAKFFQEDSGDYRKNIWPAELIEFHISDAGLLGFTYYAPLDMTETVVEDAALKPFSEVCGTFEKMLPVTQAREDNMGKKIKITKIILGYSRISERDSWDTGLVVPVWAFIGTSQLTDDNGSTLWDPESNYEQMQICINAIDGTVIDQALGY